MNAMTRGNAGTRKDPAVVRVGTVDIKDEPYEVLARSTGNRMAWNKLREMLAIGMESRPVHGAKVFSTLLDRKTRVTYDMARRRVILEPTFRVYF